MSCFIDKWKNIMLLLLTCLCADATMAAASTISGKVTDTNGNPIEGVCVNVNSGPCWEGWIDGATTSADGTYSINVADGNTYYVSTDVNCGGNNTSWYADKAYDNISAGDDCNQMTPVDAGSTGIDFVLEEGGAVSGTLFESDGTTRIDGSTNQIEISLEKGADPCDTVGAGVGFLNPDGTYTISGVEAGTYYIYTSSSNTNYLSEYWAEPASVRDCADAQTVTVTAGQTTANINFQLEEGGAVSGTLFESDGTTRIDGSTNQIEIFLEKGTDPCDTVWAGSGFLNPDGTYTISGVEAGTYYVQTSPFNTNYLSEYWADPASVRGCADAQTVTVTTGQTTANINFQLEQGITVEGTLYGSDGQPLSGSLMVAVFSGDCSNLQYVTSHGINQDGTYSVVITQPGDYYLKAAVFDSSNTADYIPEYWADPASVQDCSAAQKISMTAGSTYSGKDFQLDIGGSISGTVFQDDGTTPVTGEDICVDVYRNDPCDESWDRVGGDCLDTADGTYSITGLPAGSYYLYTNTPSASKYVEEWWADPSSTSDCGGAEQVTVTAGNTTTDIDFQLDTGGTISGTLYDESTGQPITGLAGMKVFAYTGDPCDENYEGDIEVQTDGTFQARGIKDGTFYLRTRTRNSYVDEWWDGSGSDFSCSAAQAVVVQNGDDHTDVNFYLDQGSTISGHVYERDGKTPIDAQGRELRVQVFQGDPCSSPTWVMSAATFDADGGYQTAALPDGTYYLRFKESGSDTSDDIHQREWWADPASSPRCGQAQQVVISGADITGKDFQINLRNSFSWNLILPAIITSGR